MEYKGDLYGSNTPILRDIPVFGGGANISEGAVVIRGATPGTNGGFGILGTGALADVLGVAAELHTNTVSGDDTNTGGTNLTLRKVIINPFAIWQVEYSQASADVLAVTSSSGTTVTITSLEDDIDRGWLYAVGGTGAGRLALITASASGSCTTKETTGWDSTTTVIKILPQWHQLGVINTAATMLSTTAAVGTAAITVLDNYYQSDSVAFKRLDNLLDSGVTGLNSLNVRFFARILFRNHALNTLD